MEYIKDSKKALMSWQHPIAAAGLDGSQYSNPVLSGRFLQNSSKCVFKSELTLEGALIFASGLHWLHVCPLKCDLK